ncbi:MAG: CinA family protein [Bifidobacteriaceae bacterium]|jgi:PncC family amidohydrolase|nr:CinA family protein [Bifidobacteriaceae bacterium]
MQNDEIENIARKIIEKLESKNLTIAIAESFTGGILSDAFVKIPGASKVFRGSIIAYTNDAKSSVLDVKKDVLEKSGPVSLDVAIQMADGAKTVLDADIGISTTGFAGPDSQSNDPIGLAYIALVGKGFEEVKKFHFENKGREFVRLQGLDKSLKMLYTYING